MSISTTTTTLSYTLTGSSSQALTVTFPFQQASDLVVSIGGTALTINSDYTVSGGGYNSSGVMQTGTVTVVNTGSHSSLVVSGATCTVARVTPRTQTVNFQSSAPLTASVLGQALDKVTAIEQELQNGTPTPYVNVVVDSIAALANANIPTSSSTRYIAKVTGYYAAGDGGGGDFYWDSASTTTTNTGMVVGSIFATTGRWIRMHNGILNLKWFGAQNTDVSVHTDTGPAITAISSYLSTANGNSGAIVVVPSGEYWFSTTGVVSKAGITFRGTSVTGTWASGIGSGSRFCLYNPTLGSNTAISVTASYTTFENLQFNSNDLPASCSGKGYAVTIGNGANATKFRYCYFSYLRGGIYASNYTDLNLFKCYFSQILETGIYSSTYDGVTASTCDRGGVSCNGCVFGVIGATVNGAGTGEIGRAVYICSGGGDHFNDCNWINSDYYVDVNWISVAQGSIHFLFTGCSFDTAVGAASGMTGIHFKCPLAQNVDVNINGCTFNSWTGMTAIYLESGVINTAITGNTFVVGASAKGIILESAASNLYWTTIANNTFNNVSTAVAGIELKSGAGYYTISGNTFGGFTPSTAIVDNGTQTNVLIEGNNGYNVQALYSVQPSIPSSTVAYTAPYHTPSDVFITGGTVTAIAISGISTGLTSGSFRVRPGQTITLTYSVAPTWKWFSA